MAALDRPNANGLLSEAGITAATDGCLKALQGLLIVNADNPFGEHWSAALEAAGRQGHLHVIRWMRSSHSDSGSKFQAAVVTAEHGHLAATKWICGSLQAFQWPGRIQQGIDKGCLPLLEIAQVLVGVDAQDVQNTAGHADLRLLQLLAPHVSLRGRYMEILLSVMHGEYFFQRSWPASYWQNKRRGLHYLETAAWLAFQQPSFTRAELSQLTNESKLCRSLILIQLAARSGKSQIPWRADMLGQAAAEGDVPLLKWALAQRTTRSQRVVHATCSHPRMLLSCMGMRGRCLLICNRALPWRRHATAHSMVQPGSSAAIAGLAQGSAISLMFS